MPRDNLNAATPSSLTAVFTSRDPLNLSVNAGDKYQQLARRILAYRDGQAGGVFSLRWERSETVSITSCKLGLGKMSITAVSPTTGLAGTVLVDLIETPFASGVYKGTIPPITSIHGDASISYKIICAPHRGLTPSSGPTAGGTHVVVLGEHFLGTTGRVEVSSPRRAPLPATALAPGELVARVAAR